VKKTSTTLRKPNTHLFNLCEDVKVPDREDSQFGPPKHQFSLDDQEPKT